jgi:hypothetical protein
MASPLVRRSSRKRKEQSRALFAPYGESDEEEKEESLKNGNDEEKDPEFQLEESDEDEAEHVSRKFVRKPGESENRSDNELGEQVSGGPGI